MSDPGQMKITSIPEISSIYYALVQCGYGYYTLERASDHVERIRGFASTQPVPEFFFHTMQSTCEVYPYWPRAAILEAATFYLNSDCTGYKDFERLYNQIMSASNIEDGERSEELWNWLAEFPTALKTVLDRPDFENYMEWERKWISEQNYVHEKELSLIHDCVDKCIRQYHSPVRDIKIVLNPIKCVYSADYHIQENCFVFSSGAFRTASIIHEFLHHVVHASITPLKNRISSAPRRYPGLDSSYYLAGNEEGACNAFEEFAVRELTKCVMDGKWPKDLRAYLTGLL